MTTGDDELVDAADDELSPDLYAVAPLTVSRWLLPPIFLVLGAVAGIISIEITLRAPDAMFERWVAVCFCGAVIVLAMVVGWAGRRAYLELTEDAVRGFLRVNVGGLWAVSAASLAGGIISGGWFLTLFALLLSYGMYFGFSLRNRGQRTELGRIVASLRPAVIIECLFAIIAAPIAALVSLHIALPARNASQYVTDALVIPIIGILVLVFVLRRRQPRESV